MLLFTLSCSLNKVKNNHGTLSLENKFNEIFGIKDDDLEKNKNYLEYKVRLNHELSIIIGPFSLIIIGTYFLENSLENNMLANFE